MNGFSLEIHLVWMIPLIGISFHFKADGKQYNDIFSSQMMNNANLRNFIGAEIHCYNQDFCM